MTAALPDIKDPVADVTLERFERYYLKSPGGAIRFNVSGRARLAPWFAQHGFSLQMCRTEADLHAVLRQILAIELEAARAQLAAFLEDPALDPAERAALETLLSQGKP
jgi:hypothetical protein